MQRVQVCGSHCLLSGNRPWGVGTRRTGLFSSLVGGRFCSQRNQEGEQLSGVQGAMIKEREPGSVPQLHQSPLRASMAIRPRWGQLNGRSLGSAARLLGLNAGFATYQLSTPAYFPSCKWGPCGVPPDLRGSCEVAWVNL